MKLYDISRDFFHSVTYPGDPEPRWNWVSRIENGADYNLSEYSACAHAATHIDAPRHFLKDGDTVESLPLEQFYGPCSVIRVQGQIDGNYAEQLTRQCGARILLHGDGESFLTAEGARVLALSGVLLVGTDAASVGDEQEEAGAHIELLKRKVAILEGLDLSQVCDGEYVLCAFPVRLEGMEGAPVRAVLIQETPEGGDL